MAVRANVWCRCVQRFLWRWKFPILFATVLFGTLCVRPYYLLDIPYYTRPLWDKPPAPFEVILHYDETALSPENACRLHNWTYTPRPRRVIDAVTFSVELDLLEIRLHELKDVVDLFIIVESNATFTGAPKPTWFEKNKERFLSIVPPNRLYSAVIPLGPLPRKESPFYNEGKMRRAITRLLRDPHFGIQDGDLVMMSDVDELPRASTIHMLRHCENIPRSLHFQMRNYLYSFEFFYDSENWKPHIERWTADRTYFHHSRDPEDAYLLADADFQFKMTSYSHHDRVRKPGLLKADRIQRVICSGGDIFDMLPEAFTFREFIAKWGSIPSLQSTMGLPKYLIQNAQKFRFLLPGGCQRELHPDRQ